MDSTNKQTDQSMNADTTQTQETQLKYKGFFKHVNEQPDEFIEIFVSDWNKEYFAFYVYIDKDDYEQDIDDINNLISKLNYRDQDVYIELINHSDELEYFYQYIDEQCKYSHSEVLNKELWEIHEDKEDTHFLYFNELCGTSSIDDLRDIEFMVFEDWYDVLENCQPDLYKALDESNGLGCFDIEHFYNGCDLYEIDGCIVESLN